MMEKVYQKALKLADSKMEYVEIVANSFGWSAKFSRRGIPVRNMTYSTLEELERALSIDLFKLELEKEISLIVTRKGATGFSVDYVGSEGYEFCILYHGQDIGGMGPYKRLQSLGKKIKELHDEILLEGEL